MDVLEAIKTRRSINFFDPEGTVDDELLGELLNLANLAPSSFNLQPWKVIVVREPDSKKALRKCAFDQPKAEEAPVVLIVVADPGALEENMEDVLDSWEALGFLKPKMRKTNREMINNLYGEKDSMARTLFAVKNASLFCMNLMLAARGLGLDTHPMDGFDERMLKKEFKIPNDKRIPMLIAVGNLRKGAELLPRAYRREIDRFVMMEEYSG